MQAFLALLKIRPGEERKVLGMFAYLFTVVGAFIVGRISRDTLFLELPNAKAMLPYMYLGIAVVVSGTVYVYSRIERLAPRERVTAASLAFFAATTIGLRYVLPLHHVFYWVYYVWVELFGTLMIIQCWSFASSIFNAREAKRLFAVIGGGGVLANVSMGVSVKEAVHVLGAPNLLYFVAALITAAFFLEGWLTKICRPELETQRQQSAAAPSRSGAPIKLAADTSNVLGSRHLQIIAAIVAMTFFVSTVVDYQFKISVGDTYKTSTERAAYFGFFFTLTGVLSAIVQFGLTSRLLERFGVLVSLTLLPLSLLGGSAWMLMAPSLLAATWLKGSENVLRYTINDATMQLLYVPVPASMRARAKSFIDGILKPLSIGTSGVFLLTASKILPMHELAAFTGAVLLVWSALLFRLRREYVKTLMLTLRKRRLDFADSALRISDDATVTVLMRSLEQGTVAEILHAIELLPAVDKKPRRMHEIVLGHMTHTDSEVRLASIDYVGAHGDLADAELIAAQTESSDEDVRAHALVALATLGRERVMKTLEPHLRDPSPRIRAAVLTGLIQHGGLDGILRSAEVLKAMLTSQDARDRQHGAWVLGEIRVRNFYQPVLELFSDGDAKVKLAAIQAAGKMQSPELIPALVYLLEEPRVAAAAVTSLACFGPELEPILEKVLDNPEEKLAIRHMVPKILQKRGGPKSLEMLLRFIDAPDDGLRLQVLTAAAKLREKHPEVPVDEIRAMALLKHELASFYELHLMRQGLRLDAHDVLLDDALSVRLTRTQQRMFKLLGLLYSTKEMELVWLNLCSPMPQARANAVEILDNILEGEAKRLIVPMAEGTVDPVRIAVDEFGLKAQSRGEWIETLLGGSDAWLQVAALEVVGRERNAALAQKLAPLHDSKDPLVQETARWVARRLGQEERESVQA